MEAAAFVAVVASALPLLVKRQEKARARAEAKGKPGEHLITRSTADPAEVDYAVALAYSKGFVMGLPKHPFAMAHAPFALTPRPVSALVQCG